MTTPPLVTGLEALVAGARALSVKQSRELAEILVGFDVANRYAVRDDEGRTRGAVVEERGLTGALLRNVFGLLRPMSLHVLDAAGAEVAVLRKGWSLYFHQLDVWSDGQRLGAVRRRFSLLGRRFSVEDAAGATVATIKRPLLSLWSWPAHDAAGHRVATIAKRWGGLFTELFTDADTYGLAFEAELPHRHRALLFAALFLVDLTKTEDNQAQKGLLLGD